MEDAKESGGKQAGLIRRTGRFGDDKDPNLGKETQFKQGESGNPDGRPKGRKSLSTMIQDMLDDPKFIERLSEKVRSRVVDAEAPDPEFQGTPMKAIISTALIEAMNPNEQAKARAAAREWIAKYGYGTKVDVTSKGERISDQPKIISVIQPRGGDAATEA